MFPAISLAYEKAESDIMQRAPRDVKKEHLATDRYSFLFFSFQFHFSRFVKDFFG